MSNFFHDAQDGVDYVLQTQLRGGVFLSSSPIRPGTDYSPDEDDLAWEFTQEAAEWLYNALGEALGDDAR
ncbi:hypothetical protein N8J89_07805 [Crossiella sp. CA-258035]|uniref:hypothetical protein n=1 Tax=Crossiella sp. CA-258035 TaxID=2981138 RepID=UPI0024BCB1E6|nr:hypothetical protein [Crossiella sp. CA-258035]WHT20958.1 hypothetical protein N8J89_07805 [Crossiella sp. CA-258035]